VFGVVPFVLILLLLPCLVAKVALSMTEAIAGEKITAILMVRDALTTPGRPARIEARLIRSGFLGQTGLGGEQLEFIVAGKDAGTAMTGGDGRAFFEYTPKTRGNQVITVRLAANKRVESAEATATLASWERRRPILLVEAVALTEVPKTPSVPIPSLPLDFGSMSSSQPASDAAGELKRLADFFYNVIYLFSSGLSEGGEAKNIRDWLRQHKFPVGFSVAINPGETALSAKIDEMKDQGWDQLKAGIGRTREFAQALVAHRMAVVIIPASVRDEEVPKKAVLAKDWKDARKKLQS
jgi:hypothetical protein